MARIVLACALLFAATLVGCDGDTQQTTVADTPVEIAEELGVDTWVELESPTTSSGEQMSATVFMANHSDVETEVADFLGVRVRTTDGVVIYETVSDPIWYPTVMVLLEPGETRSQTYDFEAPGPGDYSLVGYFWDDSETVAVEFTTE